MLAVSACGGGGLEPGAASPVLGSTAAQPATIALVSGESGQPVAGARVVVGGVEQTSDAAGRITVAEGRASAPVELSAPGFFDRLTTLSRLDGGRFTLWPMLSPTGLDDAFTAEIVYTSVATGAPDRFSGEGLRRWAPGLSDIEVVTLGPDDNPSYREITPAMAHELRRAVQAINGALAGRIVYRDPVEGSDQAGNGRLRVRFFPDDADCGDSAAVARLHEIPVMRNVTVTLCTAAAARLGTLVHELGHSAGLNHSSSISDVMYPSTLRRVEVPSARERLTIALMLQRSPGNRFPDNDRDAAASSSGGSTEFACR